MLKEMRYFIETRTFLINQISFKSSDLVIIKTLVLKEFTTVERFLKGIGANIGDLHYIRRKNFNLKASHNTSKGGVVLIGRDKGTVENKYQPCVYVFRDSQVVTPSLKLEHFMYFRQCSKVFHVETSPPCNGSSEEILIEVCLHVFVVKDV